MARKMYYEDNYKKNGQVEVSSLKYLFPHKYYTLQYCWICVVADADQVDGTGITYLPQLINSIRCLGLTEFYYFGRFFLWEKSHILIIIIAPAVLKINSYIHLRYQIDFRYRYQRINQRTWKRISNGKTELRAKFYWRCYEPLLEKGTQWQTKFQSNWRNHWRQPGIVCQLLLFQSECPIRKIQRR